MTEPLPKPSDNIRPLSRATLARAGVAALVIGVSLTLINQWDALTGAGNLSVLPAILVFQTPFLVVLASQALAIKQARKDLISSCPNEIERESILQAMFSHNIPARAFLLGGVMGAINTVIVAAANLIATGQATPMPSVLIVQAFTLPVLFGFLSQSLAYKRALDGMSCDHLQTRKDDAS